MLYTDHNDQKIADLVKVPLDFVQQVKDERQNFVSVSSLLRDANFNDDKIANLLNVSVDFVKKVRLIES